jgi:hypothetical protein
MLSLISFFAWKAHGISSVLEKSAPFSHLADCGIEGTHHQTWPMRRLA